MAFATFLQFLLLIVGAVCWSEVINVRTGDVETAALVQRHPQASTLTASRSPLPTPEPASEAELLDIVLVASVDGKFHALNRKDGRVLWSMPSFGVGTTSSSSTSAGPASLAPLVRTQHLDYTSDDMDDASTPETYIIEPQSGDIYVVNHEDGSLKRFPFSMPELVDMAPFTAPGDDERRIFMGRKETTLVLLELETGKIKATLSSECPPYEDNSVDLDDLEQPASRTPARPEVYIGRTDYYITIVTQGGVGRPTQNLSFSVYGPNNKDSLLQAAYRKTSDNLYIQGLPSGEMIAFRTSKDEDGRVKSEPKWIQNFSAPTVAIFDVLQGPTPLQHHPHAFVLLQPRPRVVDVIPNLNPKDLRGASSAYVGMVEDNGSLFVLTPSHYPLVAFGSADTNSNTRLLDGPSPEASKTIHDIIREKKSLERRLKCEENPTDRECLLGMHRLDDTEGPDSRIRRLLEGPSSVNQVPTPRPWQGQQWVEHSVPPIIEPTPNNSQPATHIAAEEVRKPGWEFMGVTIGLGLFSLWFLFKKFGQRDTHKSLKHLTLPNGEARASPPAEPPVVEAPPTAAVIQKLSAVPPSTPTPRAVSFTLQDSASTVVGTADEGEDTDRDPGADPSALPGKKKPRRGKRGKKKKKELSLPGEDDSDGKPVDSPSIPSANGVSDPLGLATPIPPTSALVFSATPAPVVAPSLNVSETILGFGSHGTVVFQGSLQGRAVAVKRLLKDFVTLASREVSILQESDDHPNVIRYYYQEAHANFLYIALELCPASLADIIECPDREPYRDIAISFDPKKALKQVTSGLKHLHALKLVHRDIKPQNILISTNKSNGPGRPTYRMLISDFGLCKKLDTDQTSFLPTVNGGLGAGTVGWRAPEILRGEVTLDDLSDDHSMSSRGSVATVNGSSSSSGGTATKPTRLTKSVDIFALGCLYYYTMTNGNHPYGDRFEREVNILKDAKTLDSLDRFGEEGTEASDLIGGMLHPEAHERPDTSACLLHPFFWDPTRRLNFLQDASDRFEIMVRDPRDPNLVELESGAMDIVGNDWHSRLDKVFIENLGKFRKYDGKSVQDLLRALRNKRHHYQDLPDNVKRTLGPMPEGFLAYFTKRFPRLFLHVHSVIKDTGLRTESMFRAYFELPES